jgi:DNA-directed RNA polymerase sigma subunit (sigma70/sigma32)
MTAGRATLKKSARINVTRERIRQIEAKAAAQAAPSEPFA